MTIRQTTRQRLATHPSKAILTLSIMIGSLLYGVATNKPAAESHIILTPSNHFKNEIEKIICATASTENEAKAESERFAWRTMTRTMPSYLQQDERWGNVPYAGSNLTHAGCGLVAACMTWDYWTSETLTPPEFTQRVGDSCTTDGLNDMRKFADYFEQLLPGRIHASDIFYSIDEAIDAAKNGATIWASVSGELGVRQYGGHIVLLYSPDGQTIEMRDPANSTNSRVWNIDELQRTTSWVYFYSLEAL